MVISVVTTSTEALRSHCDSGGSGRGGGGGGGGGVATTPNLKPAMKIKKNYCKVKMAEICNTHREKFRVPNIGF